MPALPVLAADGDLDTTYNTPTGFNSVTFGASDNVYGGLLQPDGKLIVIGGGRPVSNQEMSVVRYNADGTLDTGFGTSGKFSIDITVATSTDRGTCGGLQSDGKIIIGGYTRFASGNDNFAVIRLNTNGTLDTTFGTSGIAQVDFNAGSDRANALVILPDNSIVLTGFAADFSGSPDIDLGVAKLTPNGALDTTFDTDGKRTVDIGDQQDTGNGIAVQSDGKIVFCGQSFGTGVTYSVVGRLTTAGALDTTFGGGDGLFTSTILPLYALRSVIIDPDGKIVVAGDGQPSLSLDALVMRLTTAGDFDTTFNTTGYLNVNFGSGSDFLTSVVRQSDGKYIAGGVWLNSGTGFLETVVMKVTSAGALDSTFGTGGIKKIALGAGNNRVASVHLASTEKVLVSLEGGTSGAENFIAARFQNTVAASSSAPTVTTATQSSVTSTSATLGGNVTADGGASVTERGIVWGTSTGPTTANNKVQNGSGTGAFSGTVGSLPANTTIYVRAYAINSVGTSYGNEISFATPPMPAPVVTNVTSSTANGAYNAADVVSIQVTFDASVTVTGNPTLALNSGGTATYSSGSPGTTLSFNYTVGAGQTAADLDYSATNSLALAGGTINATTGGTAATLTLPSPGAAGSLGANKAIVIDTTAPTIGIGSPSQSSIVAGAGSVTYTVTYADTNFNASTLANGNITLNTTGTASGTVNVSGSGLTRTVTISSITGVGTIGISIASGTASDTAGNVAPAAGPSGTFSVTAPPPSGVTPLGTPVSQYATGSTLSYTVDAGTDRLLVVALGDPNTPTNPTAVSYNGTPMSQANATSDLGFSNDAIWYLKLGTGGSITGNIVVTFAAGGDGTSKRFIGASAYSGVDQTTPVDTNGPKISGSVTGSNLGSSLNVTSQTGDVVFDLFDSYNTPSTTTVTTGASQTLVNDAGGSITPSGGFGHYTTSTEAGAASVTMSWTSNATAILHLTMNINAAPGGATAPEINVQGNGNSIASGDVTPSSTDHTDFGSQSVVSGTIVRTFTIQNTGTANLTLSTPTVSGTHAADFSVTANPTSPVAPAGSTTFQVTFNPSALGVRTATVTILNNDGDESTYTFAIMGTGVDPEINVQGNGNSIASGDVTPSSTDHTDFGSQSVVSGTIVRTFTIQNTGTANLTLSTPTVSGTHAADFSVTANPTSPVAPAGSTTFQVTFNPSALGVRTATVTILNNDGDESTYTFTIMGTGVDPEIAVEGNATNITDGDATPSTTDHTDFGSTAVTGGTVVRTFTIKNTGSAALNLTGTPKVALGGTHAADFTVTTAPTSPVAASTGTTTFQVTFDPSAAGLRTATLSIANDDGDENPFNFAIEGTGTVAAVTPVFLGSGGTTGSGTGGGVISAPNADASGSLGRWESIRGGAVLSSSGNIAFRGHLEVGTGAPPVTVDDFQGIWKYDGTDTRLKARSGFAAPETGSALYDMLPLNPSISPNGLISFYGALRIGTGAPAVTASINQGLWSEIGGGSPRLLLRKGDTIVPGKTFRSGFAVTTSTVNTAALNAKLSSGTALLHLDVNTPAVLLTVVAEEGQAAPGGGTWIALDGNSSDPRLSANGDLGFIGWELVGSDYIQGIYSRLNTTAVGTSGAVVQARMGGTAPGTTGATFNAFERPTVFNGGMAFRGFLNANGDNAGGTKGQGVWAGAFGALTPVVRTGDTNAQIPSIPAGATVTSVWSPFSNALGSITMRVGLFDGGGETRAIMGSTGGTMRLIAKVDNAAPGLPGEVFTNFDHPVIGDGDQIAFTASTDAGSYGIWKQAPGGGALSLVMKVGDTISTSEGDKVVSAISLPGSTTDDRKFEARCLDATGRLLIHVTFADGSTSLLLGN
ncbi:MAG: choice-of-anchor D domain-containing protein [Verrucomicrobiaceae bacterium]|nr:choice-of-anchor D domain-containing protein [Verrucomicrobiaceae bacterium]